MLKAISTITNAIGALNYKGTWNASTNTPTLADGTGAKGDYYVVSTAGTQTFNSVQLFFGLGDWIVYNGAVWQRVEGGSDGNFANVTLTSTDAGATAAPLLDLYRDSASPAASDTLGEIEFNGEDSAGNKQQYAVIHGSILSPTSTAEQGQIHFETATAGALTEKMIIGTTNLVINDIGAVFNVRIEGDTDANLFYTDATNSRVGVGTISPTAKLHVSDALPQINNGVGQLNVFSNDAIAADKGGKISLGGVSGQGGAFDPYGFCYIAGLKDNATAINYAGYLAFGTSNSGGTVIERMRISSAGIVTMSAYGVGTATFSAAGVISSVSDETWKVKDGVPVDTDSMLMKLEPGYWYYNDEKKQTFGIQRQLGFYAQNVNAAIGPEAAPVPETTIETANDGSEISTTKPWGYYDRSVLAVVVISLQKALTTIESLTERIKALESR